MLNQEKIGSFISSRRKAKGLTQKQLAESIGVSDKAISRWETGKGMPDTSIMPELCKALDININELLAGEPLSNEEYPRKAEKIMMNLMKDSENKQKEKNSMLTAFLTGIALLIFYFLFQILISGGSLIWYLDIPSLILVLAILFISLAAGGQFRPFCQAFGLVFRKNYLKKGDIDIQLESIEYALSYAIKSILLGSGFSSIIAFVIVFGHLDQLNLIGPNLAVTVLVLLYAIFLSLLLLFLKGRIHKNWG